MVPTTHASDASVLIVGAGPTGLVLALWLASLGVRARIIDKTKEAGTTSRALGVHARTLEFYRQLSIADAVVAAGIKTAGVNLWVKGKKAARVPLSQMGAGLTAFPYLLMYPQDEHEKFLIERLREAGIHVERSTELIHFDPQDDGVRAVVRRPDGSEESFEAAFLAGCDGASSTVRQALTSRFPGGTYSHLFYVADVEAAGPATDNEVHIDLEDADFLGVFPLTRKGHVRVIGSVRDEIDGQRDKLKFDDVRGQALRNLKLEVSRENWFSTYRVHHRVAEHFRQGRVFLLGDAAHVHSPVGAQGMNTGIGDAVNLSWKLAAVLKGEAGDALLDTYESERIAFARRLVATTDRAFAFVTNRGALATRLRTLLVPALMPRLIAVNGFRRLLFRTLSQIGIRYRKSPLSEGSAGSVQGGDRLPWFKMPNGEDNHASISGLAWRVHVYGESPAEIRNACEELNLPLHIFAWRPEMKEAALVSGALYLIRPDGYVALADTRCCPERLRDYFRKRGLKIPDQADGAGGQRGSLQISLHT
jgi:2-polyprenyl-6-methoxyphenol hydroxylase-like FAD-dependent oxidoreductase